MSEVNEMGCAEFADVAAELALGVLTGRERARALTHLDRCEACRENVRQLMVTGEELVGLLPAIEPPAGFETRVMERLGLGTPGPGPGPAAQPGAPFRPETSRLDRRRPDGPGRGEPSAPDTGRRGRRGGGHRGRPGRLGPARRHLVPGRVAAELRRAGLTASHQTAGQVYFYDSGSPWLYMSVDIRSGSGAAGNGTVICQVEGPDGHVTTVGSFQLTDGYGYWGSPAPATNGPLTGARLVTTTGTVLATATFPA